MEKGLFGIFKKNGQDIAILQATSTFTKGKCPASMNPKVNQNGTEHQDVSCLLEM